MLRIASREAVATGALASILLVALAIRDELPPPPTPTPSRFLVDVKGASIGGETREGGVFWTIDGAVAYITVTNTAAVRGSPAIAFRVVDGPCAAGQTVEIRGIPDTWTVHVDPGGSADVLVDGLAIAAFGEVVVEARPTLPACAPSGADPRSIAFQLYDIKVTAT
ncbi:MAG: hypothetical protein ABIP17_13540 [Ilumatobacteraceae bacterium]